MNKYTKAVLAVVALSAFALPVKAEEKVWYCEMTGSVITNPDDGVKEYRKERFKMKVTPDYIDFGTGGFFSDNLFAIDLYRDAYQWTGESYGAQIHFSFGKFYYAVSSWVNATAISASCEEF
jgi:hypothetical protein